MLRSQVHAILLLETRTEFTSISVQLAFFAIPCRGTHTGSALEVVAHGALRREESVEVAAAIVLTVTHNDLKDTRGGSHLAVHGVEAGADINRF